jgi:hypothetical protein
MRVSDQQKQRLAYGPNAFQTYRLKTLQHDNGIIEDSVTHRAPQTHLRQTFQVVQSLTACR